MNCPVCGSEPMATVKRLVVYALFTASFALPAYAADMGDFIEFAGGAAAAYAVHELGHAAVGAASGVDLKWEYAGGSRGIGFDEGCEMGSGGGSLLYASGLLAQALSAEIILQSDVNKNASFVRGMMAWNVGNPLHMAAGYWLLHGQGDLCGVEHYAGRGAADIFAAAIAATAINQGYRYLQTQTWAPDWIRRAGASFTVAPAGVNGLFLGIRGVF